MDMGQFFISVHARWRHSKATLLGIVMGQSTFLYVNDIFSGMIF
jgi:hypothetical protein